MEPSEYARIAQLETHHWWYAGMRAIARDVLKNTPLPRPAKILDAGCGVGGGLRWLAEFGPVTGIDLHPLAVRHSHAVRPTVAQASIQQLPFPAHVFDLVTSFEVLYHLSVSSDEAALHEFARVLKPSGWALVRVPAHDWIRGAHDRQVHTRHRYSADELRQKLERAGLHVRRLTPMGSFLFPAAVLRRFTQSHAEQESDVQLPPAFLNTPLTYLLSAERFWLRLAPLPFGLSLLALAQKNP
jgi:SAM-dependent methyltransferase